MEQITCTLHTERAHKARWSRRLESKSTRMVLWSAIMLMLLAWLWLVAVEQNALGHLLLIPLGPLAMPVLWWMGELRHLRPLTPIESVTEISDVLDRPILGQLRNGTTPKQLAAIVSKEPGGYFYAARFAISPDMLQSIASDNPADMSVVWQKAISIARTNEYKRIDSAIVVAALILVVPQCDTLLATLQLDSGDIMAGTQWFEHMRTAINYHNQRKSFGGIGRDLSFGWAPLLNQVGVNITEHIEHGGLLRRSRGSRSQIVDQVLLTLGSPGRRNVALVGEVGVGKTTLAHGVAQRLITNAGQLPPSLQYQQLIALDAANLIAHAKGRGELEALLIQIFHEAIAAKNVILFLDEAQLFLRDGTGAVDLSSILLPVLEGGALRIILSLTNQEWLRLSQVNPGFAQLLNRVVVNSPNEHETLRIMEDQILVFEAQRGVVFMYQSLEEAYRLSERFIHEQAFPGKAIKLLEAAAGFPEQKHFVTARSVQQAVEKTFDVRVQTADSAEERDTLLHLEERIHERMINQSRAVKLVSDALRRARAGVRNQNKPIGTFLFLGPTGVGKTELTKALASVYFGGESRLVRVDLNEYSQPTDTTRLLASGATDPYSLCAQIMKQPFSVVLLDEIEKAHPNVLNMLLQMLDEGVLRDTDNKPVSFRDAIIIATSNAGADQIRAHIERGEQLEQFERAFVDELINANIFRPEFLNRFDEIILFRPLKPEELMQVVDLLVAGLNKTLAGRKVSVELTPAAKQLLVQTGYDPRLGARPLRRVVQRAVENVVAQRFLQGNVTPGQTLTLDAPELLQTLQDRES